ncbi:mate-domain-containing protein [Scleroderma yunnanense]
MLPGTSVPQDYSLVAHYVGSHVDHGGHVPTSEDDFEDNEQPYCRGPITTIPAGCVGVTPPTQTSETTPLLAPPFPHIVESVDAESFYAEKNNSRNGLWQEVKRLLQYSLPVFGTYIFEYSMAITSVVAVGHISTIALAASSLGFMTASVTGFSIIQGMANTLDTVLPSAWTSEQPQLVGLWTQRMAVLTSVILVPMITFWLHAESILLALRQEPEVARLAGIFLMWSCLGLPAYAFNCISRQYFQAQGLFTVPTRIIIFVAPINVLLNYLLVWGPESIRLGFIGAPIATAISRNLISIAYIIYGICVVPKTAWHPITTRAFTNLGFLAKLSAGSVGQVASSWWSWEIIGLSASFLGPVHLAVHSILVSTCSSLFQVPYALGASTSVRIGNLLGEQDAKSAAIVVKASILLDFAFAILFGCILVIFRHSWGYLFNNDPEVVRLVADLLPLVAFVQLFDDMAAVVGGVLRARGQQVLGATLNIGAHYTIGIPIGLWLTFKMNLQLFGLWAGLGLAIGLAAGVGLYLCLITDWYAEVDEVVVRLAIDKQPVDEEFVR